ncbi:2-C-methyl-D-erythritol 4-phosphate cytidylyltransferase [Zooshikella marina]|uniref:2-C-methyl-D-erythritol 4-phosphate cytidylyltransferase n=1 Tax=Zooshikella ganghwensis TaxID=202772 RepID=UPI001BB04284|nr:2-C-methyl-D-erythritol 4-phosphate cytidylyltransferase [Zooshikella ganghwensis]MBU2705800.1 2-C-methyl-D-erythritol 4-phosphate cytidylyltransferase [Zooshikella ganghwensis]
MQNSIQYWVIVPAAGVGKRMGQQCPKQYLQLGQYTILEHTLRRLLKFPLFTKIIVALADDDPYAEQLSIFDEPNIIKVVGGKERADSVLAGLNKLQTQASEYDWVLVHDVVRPCIRHSDLQQLITTLSDHPVGGILGVPVVDTIKRTSEQGVIKQTVDRHLLWRAFTPQMFRFQLLFDSLQQALASDAKGITDEASAIEHAGFQPLMVEGAEDNIKITRPADLALAAFYLQQQGIPCE